MGSHVSSMKSMKSMKNREIVNVNKIPGCPEMNSDIHKKPFKTKEMTEKGLEYVWKELETNPNLYCWIPVKEKVKTLNDVSIQDLPTPQKNSKGEENGESGTVYDEAAFEDLIDIVSENAKKRKYEDSLKKARKRKTPDAIVSVDDPEKYAIVKKFIRDKKLKIYGGVAINSYLPEEDKFYSNDDIPDYDFFSPDPWNDAMELADIFYKHGYKFTEAKAGIHKGTYKVFVDLWPVADITYMSPKEFEKVPTTEFDGLNVVSPFKLLESMYKEFSEPYVNPSRWPKVATREKLLQRWLQPLNKKFECSKELFYEFRDNSYLKNLDSANMQLYEIAYNYSKDNKLIFTGPIAYNTYIEIGGGQKRVSNTGFRVLSETPQENVRELFPKLLKITSDLETTTHYFPSRELNNTVYRIYRIRQGSGKLGSNKTNTRDLIIEFIFLENCTPFQELLGRLVVSIDYLKYDLFDTAVFGDTEKEIEDAKCKLQYLERIQYEYYDSLKISELDVSPFQRFIINCRGPFKESVKVEILNKWLEREERRRKTVKEYRNGYKIVTTPIEEKECRSGDGRVMKREECVYPCFWNRYIGKCTEILKKTYIPANDEIED